MNAFNQIHSLGLLGIEIKKNAARLKAEWPQGCNVAEILEDVKANKAAILEYLETAFSPRFPPDMPEFYERTWHRRCLELEALGMGEHEAERNAFLSVLGLWNTIKQGGTIPAQNEKGCKNDS